MRGYKELNGMKRIPPSLCTVGSFRDIYYFISGIDCMLDYSEQDGASGDTEEKMRRRSKGFFPRRWSRYCGQGLERLRWHLSRNATCCLEGGVGSWGGGGNRK